MSKKSSKFSEGGYKLCYIAWDDSFGVTPGWEETSESKNLEPISCFSVGWVIGKSDKVIKIASNIILDNSSVGVNEQVCGVMVIPVSAITKIHYF